MPYAVLLLALVAVALAATAEAFRRKLRAARAKIAAREKRIGILLAKHGRKMTELKSHRNALQQNLRDREKRISELMDRLDGFTLTMKEAADLCKYHDGASPVALLVAFLRQRGAAVFTNEELEQLQARSSSNAEELQELMEALEIASPDPGAIH